MSFALSQWNTWAGRYSFMQSKVNEATEEVSRLGAMIEGSPDEAKDPQFKLAIHLQKARITVFSFLQSIFKEFMEYWKGQVDDEKVAMKTSLSFAASARG